ncbi:hypothetical protein OPV22_015399 [Ensete ventricosum]|uniref:Pentacotripeptide-repeat region of PRORP domain-containing protein n=1 Tax=Ensete ventricosum TaxID=4639 RepID=A0AAV8RBT8_ENSVE|nr:hypothetical protein OPV22_015399 [Ensete ventricosum]
MRFPPFHHLYRRFAASSSSAAATASVHLPSAVPAADPSTTLDLDTILETLTSYASDWQRALDFFHWSSATVAAGGPTHTAAALSRTIDILGKHFEFPLAWSLLSSHPLTPPDLLLPSFRSLFNRLAAAHLVDDALTAFDRAAAEHGLRDRVTFHLLVDALCDHRHAAEAEELCLRSKSPPFPPDTKTYNLLLRGWLKMGWWSKCREFWEEMDRKGVDKDLHSYSIYMDILSKSRKPWTAVKLYKEMKKKGFRLDVVAYNTAIQAIGLSQGVDFSVRMYREMLDSGCKPNVATFNTIIKLLCQEGRFREGYAFVDQMRQWGYGNERVPAEDGYICDADEQVWKKGMVDMARKYNEEMVAKGLSPKRRKVLGTKGPGMGSDDDHDDELTARYDGLVNAKEREGRNAVSLDELLRR